MKIPLKIWILIIALILSLLAIKPSFETGIRIESVNMDSLAFENGLRAGQIIKSINGEPIKDKIDYSNVIKEIFKNGEEQRIDIITKENEFTLFTNQTPEITVDEIPLTRIQTGLDLQGGARALVQPDEEITAAQLQDLVAISRNRFNVYGLSDVKVNGVTDLVGDKFILIEVAGATPDDLEELISQQGKFEAKIGNQTVFVGGEKDISDVCRSDASCAAVTGCTPSQDGGQYCNFRFTIYLKESAAQKHADMTRNLSLDETGKYLSEKLTLLVDDKEVDSLLIGSSLRGQVATQISIQGSGSGSNQEDALKDARTEMNRLQTVLLTGSLPYKLNIVKLDTISPTLGKDFLNLILLTGVASILIVSLIVFARYKKIKTSLALLLTSFSEIIIILGVAALINWNLDLPSIAGILATIGTGVDQQIVIIDEAGRDKEVNIKTRIKRALFIIMASYFTLVAAMIPLGWAGAGLFKGFAITTIIGATSAVLITRPAFAEMIKRIES